MFEEYLLVNKSILPECLDAVIKAKELLDDGRIKSISAAVKSVGISRSTFYKYKDLVIKPSQSLNGKNAVISLLLINKAGKLNSVLTVISEAGANILTMTQSLPIKGRANVTMSLDISTMPKTIGTLLEDITKIDGVTNTRLIAIE